MNPEAIKAIALILSGSLSLLGLYVLPGTGLEVYAFVASASLLSWLARTPGDIRPGGGPPILPMLGIALLVGCPLPPLQTWPQYLECAPEVSEIIGTISRILLDGTADQRELKERGKDELQKLAYTHGADVVACTVDKLVDQWRSPGSTTTPETLAASVRGENFLRDVGVQQ